MMYPHDPGTTAPSIVFGDSSTATSTVSVTTVSTTSGHLEWDPWVGVWRFVPHHITIYDTASAPEWSVAYLGDEEGPSTRHVDYEPAMRHARPARPAHVPPPLIQARARLTARRVVRERNSLRRMRREVHHNT